MYNRLSEDMDINAGPIVDGENTIEEIGIAVRNIKIREANPETDKNCN